MRMGQEDGLLSLVNIQYFTMLRSCLTYWTDTGIGMTPDELTANLVRENILYEANGYSICYSVRELSQNPVLLSFFRRQKTQTEQTLETSSAPLVSASTRHSLWQTGSTWPASHLKPHKTRTRSNMSSAPRRTKVHSRFTPIHAETLSVVERRSLWS